jgi:molybdopterin converting factor small subunit
MTELLFFGRLRDVAGYSATSRELPESVRTVAELRAWLREQDNSGFHINLRSRAA